MDMILPNWATDGISVKKKVKSEGQTKICFVCKIQKDINAFQKASRPLGMRLRLCRECANARARVKSKSVHQYTSLMVEQDYDKDLHQRLNNVWKANA